MDTKKNMSREQLLAYMRDNCTEAEAQQVRMWLRERLKDPGMSSFGKAPFLPNARGGSIWPPKPWPCPAA